MGCWQVFSPPVCEWSETVRLCLKRGSAFVDVDVGVL